MFSWILFSVVNKTRASLYWGIINDCVINSYAYYIQIYRDCLAAVYFIQFSEWYVLSIERLQQVRSNRKGIDDSGWIIPTALCDLDDRRCDRRNFATSPLHKPLNTVSKKKRCKVQRFFLVTMATLASIQR